MITSHISGKVKLRDIIDIEFHFYLVDVIIAASLFLHGGTDFKKLMRVPF